MAGEEEVLVARLMAEHFACEERNHPSKTSYGLKMSGQSSSTIVTLRAVRMLEH